MSEPETIPAMVLIVDERGHTTMHLLPEAQNRTLRLALGTPTWDSSFSDGLTENQEGLLRTVLAVARKRVEHQPVLAFPDGEPA